MPATRVGPTARLLYRDHQPSLWLEDASRAYAFDGDPALFRLGGGGLADPQVSRAGARMGDGLLPGRRVGLPACWHPVHASGAAAARAVAAEGVDQLPALLRSVTR